MMKRKMLIGGALLTVFGFGGMTTVLHAQGSGDAVMAKEIEVKQKEIELEKAKLDNQKAEMLALEKAKVELAKKELELEKARLDLAVKETETELQMQLSGDVLFDTNKAVLKEDAQAKLKQVGLILAAYPEGAVRVTGHTDSRGEADTNMGLAKERAEAVKVWLMNQSGLKDERIKVKAMGEEVPVASNDTADGRQKNRRVEIAVNKG